jgi:sulfite exporter TauE/SafE/copper chaperone CopZ
MQTHTFHVQGMHCRSCVVLTETELAEIPGVATAHASLSTKSVTVTGDFGEKSAEEIANTLSAPLTPHGYTLLVETTASTPMWREFGIALPAALGVIGVFFLLQKLGLVNLVTTERVGFGTALLIGGIASVSTCMAIVGGLTLSLSAHFAKSGETTRPQLLFHIGRLLSFFVFGGMIGALGSAFELNATTTFVLNMLVAGILLILGINLLDVFPWMKRLEVSFPSAFGKRVHRLKKVPTFTTPFLIGVATFFLPCGFTQSMQIYTLTAGSFFAGAWVMSAFALGTLPVLALLSFGTIGLQTKTQSGIFFKGAGLVVIFFGIFNAINALVAIGILPPFFSF